MEYESDGTRRFEPDAQEAQDVVGTGRETLEELASVDDTGLGGLRGPAEANGSNAEKLSFSTREGDDGHEDEDKQNFLNDSGAESHRSDSLKTHVRSSNASGRAKTLVIQ